MTMERFLFIPVNSLNVNNILSSESISPPVFYENRGYGFKRYERILSNPYQNSFLIYSKLPITNMHRSDREEFPVVIAVPSTYLTSLNDYTTNEVTIYQSDKTIYLNWDECFFIYRNLEEKNKTIASTKRSLEVKHVDKYINQFYLLEDFNFDHFNWSDSLLENLQDAKSINSTELTFDQKFNKIKGLIYGYAAGDLRAQSSEMLSGRRYYKDFINVFSVLLNELSTLSIQKGPYVNQSLSFDTKFKQLKDFSERINILFGTNESDDTLIALSKSFNVDPEKLTELDNYKYLSTRNTILSILTHFIKEKDKELYTISELLDNLITEAKKCSRNGSQYQFKKLEQDFEITRNLVSKKISTYQNSEIDVNQLLEIPFKLNSNFYLSSKISRLSEIENGYLTISLNELLSRTIMSSSDEIAQQRLDIIKCIADKLKEVESTEDSDELAYLRKFHKSLKTVGVGFKVKDSDNQSLQGLASFLSRYSELEKLQDFMEKNAVSDFSIGYSLWGASYGYSNLSKILLTSVERNEISLKVITNFLNHIIQRTSIDSSAVRQFLDEIKKKSNSIQIDEHPKKDQLNEPSIRYKESKSFESVIRSNKKLNNDTWVDLINQCFKDVLEQKLPDSPMFGNEYKVNEFHSLLKIQSKSLPRFGMSKVDEVTKLFREYLG